MSDVQTDEIVSVERDGRVLSGLSSDGATTASLDAVMDRHDTSESVDPAPTTTAPTTETPTPKPTRGQARFSELTQQAKEARAEAARVKSEYDQLKAQFDAARQSPSGAPAASSQPAPDSPPVAPREGASAQFTSAEFKPQPFMSLDAYLEANQDATYDDYLEARTLHRFRQEQQHERGQWQAQQQAQERHARVTALRGRIDAFRATTPDFDARIGAHATLQPSPVMVDAIERSERGAEILYHLASNPAACVEIARESAQAGPETVHVMRRYLESLVPSSSASPASLASGSVPPPPPMQPVGTGSRTTVLPSAELAKRSGFDFDKSGYREKRAAERGVSRR